MRSTIPATCGQSAAPGAAGNQSGPALPPTRHRARPRSSGSSAGAISKAFAARPGKVRQDAHRRGIGRGLFLQPLGQGGEDHARLGQFLRRLRGRQDREVFQEQRQVIGQFVRRDFEALRFVAVTQVDHRLAPVAAFAVDVFEQVERHRPPPVEQRDIAFLGCRADRRRKVIEQRLEGGALLGAQQAIGGEQFPQFWAAMSCTAASG
jgi:hypothetical protein